MSISETPKAATKVDFNFASNGKFTDTGFAALTAGIPKDVV